MLTVFLLLALAAFVCTVLAAANYPPPLWVAVLMLTLIELLRALPLGR
jgi:ABC-type phosphate/phosphonate transport system permease subunit